MSVKDRRQNVATIAAIAAAGAIALIIEKRPKKNKQQKPEARHSQEYCKGEKNYDSSSVAHPEGCKCKECTHQWWEKGYWACSIMISTVALIGAFFAAGFTGCAYVQTKRQADIAEIANRAFVSTYWPDDSGQLVRDITSPENPRVVIGWEIQPYLENWGNTLAVNLIPFDRLYFIPTADISKWKPDDIKPDGLIGENLGAHLHDGMQEMVISQENLQRAVSGVGVNVFCLWGFYREVFNPHTLHHFRSCNVVRIMGNPFVPKANHIISRFGNFEESD